MSPAYLRAGGARAGSAQKPASSSMQRYPNREHYLNSLQNASRLQSRAYGLNANWSHNQAYPDYSAGPAMDQAYPDYSEGPGMQQAYPDYSGGPAMDQAYPENYHPAHLAQMVQLGNRKLWVGKRGGVRYASPYVESRDKKNPKAPKYHGAVVAAFGKKARGKVLIVPGEGDKHKARWPNMKNAQDRGLVTGYRAKINRGYGGGRMSRGGGMQLYAVPTMTPAGMTYTYQYFPTGRQQRQHRHGRKGGNSQHQHGGKGQHQHGGKGKPQKRRKPRIKDDPYGVVAGTTELIKKLAEQRKLAEKPGSSVHPPSDLSDPQYHWGALHENLLKLIRDFRGKNNYFQHLPSGHEPGNVWNNVTLMADPDRHVICDVEYHKNLKGNTTKDHWNAIINHVRKLKKNLVGAIRLVMSTETKEKQTDAFTARLKKSFSDVHGSTVREMLEHAAATLTDMIEHNAEKAENMRFEKGVLLAVASHMVKNMSWTDYLATLAKTTDKLLKFAMKHQKVFKKALKNAKSKAARAEKKAAKGSGGGDHGSSGIHHARQVHKAHVEMVGDEDDEDNQENNSPNTYTTKHDKYSPHDLPDITYSHRNEIPGTLAPAAAAPFKAAYSSMSLRS